MKQYVTSFANALRRSRILEVSLAIGGTSLGYSYFHLHQLERNCAKFSVNKEYLLSFSPDILNSNEARQELDHQLSFIKEEVLDYYSMFKSNQMDKSLSIVYGCSGIGAFVASTILTISDIKTGRSRLWKQCGLFFVLHFICLISSFSIHDELNVDKQWFAQLLLCYRSGLLKLGMSLDHYVSNNNGIKDIKNQNEILTNVQNILDEFQNELDLKQIKEWIDFSATYPHKKSSEFAQN